MNIRYITILYALVMFIGGCANQKVVQSYIPFEAQGQEVVNAITMGCSSPFKLEQDCDNWQGANRLVEVKGLRMRVSSSKNGRLVLLMVDIKECGYGSLHCSTVSNNRNYELIKNLFIENDIKIRSVTPVVNVEYIAGYLIFLNKDGYSLIKDYTVGRSTSPSNSKKTTEPTKRTYLASDYEKSLVIPDETENYILIGREIFDEPSLGTMLGYENKNFPEDNITLYVYPIPNISWDNAEETINQELDYVLEEIDIAVKQGVYKSREMETKSNFMFTHNTQEYNGVKSKLKLTDKNGVLFYSSTYLFISEDKFIKFRISVDSRVSREIDGNNIIESLLPLIKVPVESEYMKNIRGEQRERMQKEYVQMLLQNSL